MTSAHWDLRERTFCFARDIVVFCRKLSENPGVPRQVAGQLLRCGTSVGANAQEAKAAYSRREFASKNSVVLKEARETRYWLRLIEATNLAPISTYRELLGEAEELVAIFTAVVKTSRMPLQAGRGRGRLSSAK